MSERLKFDFTSDRSLRLVVPTSLMHLAAAPSSVAAFDTSLGLDNYFDITHADDTSELILSSEILGDTVRKKSVTPLNRINGFLSSLVEFAGSSKSPMSEKDNFRLEKYSQLDNAKKLFAIQALVRRPRTDARKVRTAVCELLAPLAYNLDLFPQAADVQGVSARIASNFRCNQKGVGLDLSRNSISITTDSEFNPAEPLMRLTGNVRRFEQPLICLAAAVAIANADSVAIA